VTKRNLNQQELFWEKNYAKKYIAKNRKFDRKKGVEAWKLMLKKTHKVSSVLECGCNIGRNISFLEKALPKAEKSVVEISKPAFDFVTRRHKLKYAFFGTIRDSHFEEQFDLVFTVGVLIHIHPAELLKNMKKLYDHSKKYVLIGEYFNRTPVMLKYQGESDRLFKQDFGKTFIQKFPVSIVDYGFLWGYTYDKAGFDDITWWLFKKKEDETNKKLS